MSTDDIAAARARRREHLTRAVASLQHESGFRAWLRAARVFHHYSPLNVLHIVTQCPHASHVAGFRVWRERLGYQVRRGEKAIRIIVPHVRKHDEADDSDDDARPGVVFRLGCVFDRSQVDPIPGRAKPLEPPVRPAPIDGESHAHLIEPLESFGAEIGFRVERRELPPDTGGVCDSRRSAILLRDGQPPNAEVRVLVHELAHALGVGYRSHGRERAEAIVECVAYLVCARVGLDVEASSVPYIVGWAADDPAVIERDARAIDRLAARIDRALDGTQSAVAAA
jgi:antirestriction protein ArdC